MHRFFDQRIYPQIDAIAKIIKESNNSVRQEVEYKT